jgi:hypothetical protein
MNGDCPLRGAWAPPRRLSERFVLHSCTAAQSLRSTVAPHHVLHVLHEGR